MRITLIGMSGVGKSYWARALEVSGFKRFGCDDLIGVKLAKELKQFGLSANVNDVGRWLGQPFTPDYWQRSQRYLDLEAETMLEIVKLIESQLATKTNLVVDATGSVIYLNKAILKSLKPLTTIVYLDTPAEVRRQAYELYLKDPKPVIWGNIFKKSDGESDWQTLARCYPRLLEYRVKLYQQLADLTLDYQLLRKTNLTVENFLELIFP